MSASTTSSASAWLSAGRTRNAALLTLCVLVFGAFAVLLGQSNNWDLRNYHLYNGWAWLNHRESQDLAVAHAQSWFNPVLPAGLYLLLTSLSAWLGTFALGCLQGLNLIPLLAITRRLLPQRYGSARAWLAPLLALTGMLGATGRGELGTTFGDTLVCLPLLIATAVLISRAELSLPRLLLSGCMLGLAVGLKLTTSPIALGIGLALPCLARSPREALYLLLCSGSAALIAFLICDGWWMWHLWQTYANPLFPMFGSLFGGEYAPPLEMRDARYLPRNWTEWLFYPLVWAKHPRIVSELWFLDLRIPFLFLAALALPLWVRRASGRAGAQTIRFILVAIIAGYVAWLFLFGYYRYLVVLEMLAPSVLACALAAAFQQQQQRAIVLTTALCALLLLTTKPPNWGRLPHYGNDYVEIALPNVPNLATATVLLVDGEPLSFLALGFPPTTRFVRIGGGMLGPPLPEWRLDSDVAARIDASPGPLYALMAEPTSAAAKQALARRLLRLDPSECHGVYANLMQYGKDIYLCTVQRETQPL